MLIAALFPGTTPWDPQLPPPTGPPACPPSPRSTHPPLGLAAAIPASFSNPGGPPFLDGAAASADGSSVGYTQNSTFVFVNNVDDELEVERGAPGVL
jgi:hypothetical protein